MKIKIFSPNWGHTWLKIYPQIIEKMGHEVSDDPDIVLSMWADNKAMLEYPNARHSMFMRRYELFSFPWVNYPWEKIDNLFLVNKWVKDFVDSYLKYDVNTHLVYNAVDTSKWTFKERGHGNKIGMACHVHPKKNLPLAVQIMDSLPRSFELHIAGDIQDGFTYYYMEEMRRKLDIKIFFDGHVNNMDVWWEDKNYCLSTSLSEGNPNNVIEAMAKGIKPIVHSWPGAEDQFDEVFSHVHEAVQMICSDYDSERYLATVNDKFSLKNYEKVIDILCQSQVSA